MNLNERLKELRLFSKIFTLLIFVLLVGFMVLIYFDLISFAIFLFVPLLFICSLIFLILNIVSVAIAHRASKDFAAAIEQKNRFYKSLPHIPITDFRAELEQTRANFAADRDPEKNKIPRSGIRLAKELDKLYDYNAVIRGEIYYACLVQANKEVFDERSTETQLPAIVVYSLDPHFDSNPLELLHIAKNLDINKNPYFMQNEENFFYNILLQKNHPAARNIFATTVMIDRRYIPRNAVFGRIFPLICAPRYSPSTFVVDDKYWSKKLVTSFMYNLY